MPTEQQDRVKRAWDLVTAAKSGIENVSVEEADAERIAGTALIVDVREPEERFANGAIPGALHAPRGRLEFLVDPNSGYHWQQFDPDRRIILHCSAGGRSVLATATLKQMGYADVASLEGGFEAWKKAGKPVEDIPKN